MQFAEESYSSKKNQYEIHFGIHTILCDAFNSRGDYQNKSNEPTAFLKGWGTMKCSDH